jgi:RNA polymerase sigma factor (sigma-70 family)
VSPLGDSVRQYHDEAKERKVTMGQSDWLAERFETHRSHLRAVAYRMLGSLSEADDAVQESWLRLSQSDRSVENLGGWLTTVVARICLDMLRSRKSRQEEPLEPPISQIKMNLVNWLDPEQEAMMADSVGRALLVVLDTLPPAERLAFVLHDVFAMPFEEIAPIVGRSLVAAKKLASRARLRVQGASRISNADLVRQRKVIEAFLAASRTGDMNALLAVLDPKIVRQADRMALPPGADTKVHGADNVVRETVTNSGLAQFARIAVVNGTVGLIVVLRRRLRLVLSFTIRDEKIVEIEVIADPVRLRRAKLSVLREA